MPKAAAGTPKAIANAMKAKGLGRLRWYCQICEKQCRDENGFQMHSQSEAHLRQMLLVGKSAGKHIDQFSQRFQQEFVGLLSRRYSTQRVRANQVYQEYIQDKTHLHMNATRWVTLTEFIKHLGRSGIVRCDETDKGWFVQWVDNNPKTLARQAEIQKREKGNLDDESRARKHLKEQIERAKAQAEEEKKRSGAEEVEAGLKRAPEEGKFKLEIAPVVKKEDSEASTPPAGASTPVDVKPTGISFGTLPAAAAKPGIVNPLKRPAPVNVFKQAKAAKTSSSSDTTSSAPKAMPMSAAERLMKEEEMRKQSRGSQGYAGFGPKRGG